MPRAWDDLLDEQDRAVYRDGGFGRRVGGGTRPALLVIDVTCEFVGDRPEPLLQSVRRFPHSCGEGSWAAMRHIRALLDRCREASWPVFYTTGMEESSIVTRGSWTWKNERALDGAVVDPNRIPDLVAPAAGETLIRKTKPSGFFGTQLVGYLVAQRVDTVLVVGGTTSGCVRATVVDAFSHYFKVLVVEEGTFDRMAFAHKANLFDMQAKSADVVSIHEALRYLDRVDPRTGSTSR